MRNKKTVYSYDKETFEYNGQAVAWESPLEPGVYHIPSLATESEPIFTEGKITKWNGREWILEDIPLPPEPPKPSLEEVRQRKINQLASNRTDLAEHSFVKYKGKTYSNSQNARIAILSYIGKLNSIASSAYFTYPDKEIVDLYKTDFTALRDLIEEREMDLRKQEIKIIELINDCKTIEELESISIDLE